MKDLTAHLGDYLRVRPNLGFDLAHTERVLRKFTAFADSQGVGHVTMDLFLQWRESYGAANNNTWSSRLSMVRVFASWLQGIDERTEVPPVGLITGKPRRARPYIYTDDQISEILAEAGRLQSPYGLRGWMCSTLFGLIAVTGLRISEALGLDDVDLDPKKALLTVRRGKNGRSRTLPITGCTVENLNAYRAERTRLLSPSSPALFLLESGTRPSDCCARYNFALVCQRMGLRSHQKFYRHGHGPRLHDLRHTFAVKTIIDWYRSGLDVDRRMSELSAYLGHQKPEYTYWYIEATPELLKLASDRASGTLNGGRS